MNELPTLTDEQIAIIHDMWTRGITNIQELTRKAFKDESLDGRTNQGKAVKIYLASRGQAIKTTKKETVGDMQLTEHHKEFIRTNSHDMKPLEMTKVLFPDREITTLLGAEGRAVFKYAQTVRRETVDFWDEPAETKEYRPPRAIQSTIGLVNRYVANQMDPTKVTYDLHDLRPYELKCLRALQGYLATIRFRYQASSYEKKADRTLFESSFIRMTHDKADLSAADVDMYVAAAAEMVNVTREERKILRLEEQLDQILGGEGEEKQRLSQAFVELLNQTRTKWDASKSRYKGFVDSLESTRAKRDEHRTKRNESVLNLLEAWIKDDQTRNDIIAFGEKEKAEDREEVKRLTQFDGVIALIAGQTHTEAEM